jgi:hypothetical protein
MFGNIQEQITSLNRQVAQLYQTGQYGQAIEVASRAYDLARKHLGEGHQIYATSLGNLAAMHQAVGDYTAAEPLQRWAVEATHAALGEKHPDYAAILNMAAWYN